MTFAREILFLLAAGMVADAALAETVATVRPVRAGSVIAEADLEVLDDSVPGTVSGITEAVGKEAKVTLYPGRPIQLNQLGPPALVDRNQLVRMVYSSGPLSIATEGRVLDRAGIGESVRVMNLTSRQTVSGVVAPDGTIEVGP